jgi:hypothetical protein
MAVRLSALHTDRTLLPRNIIILFLVLLGAEWTSGPIAAEGLDNNNDNNNNTVALVRERAILTERPPLVGKVSANFCW